MSEKYTMYTKTNYKQILNCKVVVLVTAQKVSLSITTITTSSVSQLQTQNHTHKTLSAQIVLDKVNQ